MKPRFLVCILVAAAALVAGCSSNLVSRKWAKASFSEHPRLAILPFDNLSSQEQVGAKITEFFQTTLATRSRFELVEPGTVYDCLRRHRIRSSSLITSPQLDSIAAELNIKYYISGSVLEYRELDNTYLGKVPQVSFNTRLVDCSSRNTVWTGESNGRGDKGELVFGLGAIRSADDLARKMVSEAADQISGLFKP